ncbi:MAG: hypothetical protein KDA61_06105, partial [Planctomycetales bacterium]|nr:hypothetical protein [Planctomycetales bacterium]
STSTSASAASVSAGASLVDSRNLVAREETQVAVAAPLPPALTSTGSAWRKLRPRIRSARW